MAEGVGVYFEEHREAKDLGRLALRGGIVSLAMQYGNGAFQIAAAVILARLLAPEDFGLVAIVTVLTSFAPFLIDCGLGDATTQRSKITQSQVSSLFWLSSGIGLLVAVVVAACSPLIAWLYREPRLEPIALCIAITFVLWGASNQHLALLRRALQFGRIAKIQLLGTLAGIAVAVAIAICGYGYWALVLRPIANAFCVAFGAWLVCRWRPGFPVFDNDVKSMVRFGLHVVGFSVTYTLARAVDRIALGLFYRADQVGYYQNAVTLYENSIFSALVQMHTVGSAALSKLQSHPAALRKKYEAALSTLAFFVMPLAAILSVTAEDLTVILLGEKWPGRFAPEYHCLTRHFPGRRRLTGLAASFNRESGPLAELGNRFARCPGRGGSRRSALWRHGGRRRGRHREPVRCRTLDSLCGPPDRHRRRCRDARRRAPADRSNQYRGSRLVPANDDSDRLFQLDPHFIVGRLLYLLIPCRGCGPVSACRAD
jgi:hypothetical protein